MAIIISIVHCISIVYLLEASSMQYLDKTAQCCSAYCVVPQYSMVECYAVYFDLS